MKKEEKKKEFVAKFRSQKNKIICPDLGWLVPHERISTSQMSCHH